MTGDLRLYSPEGDVLGELIGFAVKRATRATLLSSTEELEDLLYEVVWRERPLKGGLQSADSLTNPSLLQQVREPSPNICPMKELSSATGRSC